MWNPLRQCKNSKPILPCSILLQHFHCLNLSVSLKKKITNRVTIKIASKLIYHTANTPVGIGPTLPVKLLLASVLWHSGASAISLSLTANSPKYCPSLTITVQRKHIYFNILHTRSRNPLSPSRSVLSKTVTGLEKYSLNNYRSRLSW